MFTGVPSDGSLTGPVPDCLHPSSPPSCRCSSSDPSVQEPKPPSTAWARPTFCLPKRRNPARSPNTKLNSQQQNVLPSCSTRPGCARKRSTQSAPNWGLQGTAPRGFADSYTLRRKDSSIGAQRLHCHRGASMAHRPDHPHLDGAPPDLTGPDGSALSFAMPRPGRESQVGPVIVGERGIAGLPARQR